MSQPLTNQYDVIIIGAGIVGCAAARALSRYTLRILVLEKGADVSAGATKANSGILHAGYDCIPGTQKAFYNVAGLGLFKTLAGELDIPRRQNGSMVVASAEEGEAQLRALYDRGRANGVTGMTILDTQAARALEPRLLPSVRSVLYAPTAGIVSPYEAAIAFAENAAVNGVIFALQTEVTGLTYTPQGAAEGYDYAVHAGNAAYRARIVINAAGTESGNIANHTRGPVSVPPIVIHPQRGQYYLLDNTCRDLIKHTIFQLPTHRGKGVLLTPTVDGNILMGPTAEAVEDPRPGDDPHATETTREGLQEILEKARLTLADIPVRERIAAFAGVRAKHAWGDFIIEESPAGFVHAIGIDSPGLTAAPAIGDKLAELALARLANILPVSLQPGEKSGFISRRPGITRFRDLTFDEQTRLVAANPAYGTVVCRCETITQAEITEAMARFSRIQPSPVAANLDAVKRRTRAQMGRCQGGFCTLRLIELISRAYNLPEAAVTKDGPGTAVSL